MAGGATTSRSTNWLTSASIGQDAVRTALTGLISMHLGTRRIFFPAAPEAAPGTMNAIARYAAAGEQARFLPRVPFKRATLGRDFACVPLDFSPPDLARAIVVRPCSLLDALIYIFDTLWARRTDHHRPGAVGERAAGGPTR